MYGHSEKLPIKIKSRDEAAVFQPTPARVCYAHRLPSPFLFLICL